MQQAVPSVFVREPPRFAFGRDRSVTSDATKSREPSAYNEAVLRFALALLVFSGALAGAVTEYSTVPGFLKKWGICALAAAALFVAGVVLGNITRSAMCASVWVCE
jgi:hypothetical protein